MKTQLICGIANLAMAVSIGAAVADDTQSARSPEELAKAAAKAATPGPAHKKLQPLAGKWTYTCKLWMEPGKSPIETKGTIERRWILGGRFLEERIVGTGLDGKPRGFEGLGLIGYDNNLQKYIYTFACTMGTGTSTGEGTSPSPGKFTFQTQCSCPLEQKTITGRDDIQIVDKNKVVMESYKTVGGKAVKVMELVAIRKK